MPWMVLALLGTFTATAALADVDCNFFRQAFAPTFESATVDGEDAFIDPTPDVLVAGPNRTIDLHYADEVLTFSREDQHRWAGRRSGAQSGRQEKAFFKSPFEERIQSAWQTHKQPCKVRWNPA